MTEPEAVPWWDPSLLDRDRWGEITGPLLERILGARDGERMPHSLLLVGPAGMGRELAAVETAALLSCPDRGPLWCPCSSCARARSGVHPDVSAVRPQGAKNQIGIDQVRAVVEAASGRPYEAAARVWILDGVEAGRFGAEAANAFLKTLEEPASHACFILLAANPEAVVPTIRSRCQQLHLPGVVALASLLGSSQAPVELAASTPEGPSVRELVAAVRAGLESAEENRLIRLIRAAQLVADSQDGFQITAAAAMEAATAADEGSSAGDDLARLAADLLAAERRSRALNLDRGRQILSCLMRWHLEKAE
ncbi:MAG: hypothetical protein LJE95_13510 [Acidobacteria bacterium]|nr:hypothetical protein [Acidobacteriota bacterium]